MAEVMGPRGLGTCDLSRPTGRLARIPFVGELPSPVKHTRGVRGSVRAVVEFGFVVLRLPYARFLESRSVSLHLRLRVSPVRIPVVGGRPETPRPHRRNTLCPAWCCGICDSSLCWCWATNRATTHWIELHRCRIVAFPLTRRRER